MHNYVSKCMKTWSKEVIVDVITHVKTMLTSAVFSLCGCLLYKKVVLRLKGVHLIVIMKDSETWTHIYTSIIYTQTGGPPYSYNEGLVKHTHNIIIQVCTQTSNRKAPFFFLGAIQCPNKEFWHTSLLTQLDAPTLQQHLYLRLLQYRICSYAMSTTDP